MSDVENWLLATRLRAILARLASAADAASSGAAWPEADAAVAAAGASEDAAVALPVLERDARELAALLDAWHARKAPLSAWDQAVLKRAINALKKRIKLTRADDEVTSNRNPLSRGVSSSIVGVRPPEQYSKDIWDLLVAHGRLREGPDGVLELASEGPQA